MGRIHLKGASETNCGTSNAGGSTFDKSTLVRLVNTSTSNYKVFLTDGIPGGALGDFTLMAGESVLLEKRATDGIYAQNADVKGTPVRYTH